MNYLTRLKELRDKYTDNGVVDLNELNDDIVTLLNIVEDNEKRLSYMRHYRYDPGRLPEVLRRQKDELYFLETIYQDEVKKGKGTSTMDEFLAASAKEAKEVEKPGVAAAGKQPKSQDFQGAEIEKVGDDYDWQDSWALTTGTEEQREFYADMVNPTPVEKEDNVVPVGDGFETEEDETFKGVMLNNEPLPGNEIVIQMNDGYTEANMAIIGKEDVYDKEIALASASHEEPMEDGSVNTKESPKIEINSETDVIEIKTNILDENGPDFFIPSEDINVSNPCADCDIVGCISHPDNDTLKVFPYPVESEFETETEAETVSPEEDLGDVDTDVYEPFYSDKHRIYASFSLTDYTNLVNTDSVKGRFNDKEKTIELTFNDIRDYGIFHELIKEKNTKVPFLKRFKKKPKNIFMYVHEKHDEPGCPENEVTKTYEFMDCSVIDVYSTSLPSRREAQRVDILHQEWFAVFKYKKLKVY